MSGSDPTLPGRHRDGADIISIVSQRLAEKHALSRRSGVDNRVSALADPGLIAGAPEERIGQWLELFASTEHSWDAAAQLWRGGFSAPATALAVSTLEETAKLAVERFRVAGQRLNASRAQRRRRPRYDHRTKHLIVAMQGALTNDRIDRHLGLIHVNDFLGLVERGELEDLRRSCLHAEPGTAGPSIPRNAVGRERSAWIVALAGEVLAEIQFELEERERFLAKVDAFEQAAGYQTPGRGEAPDYSRWTAATPDADSLRCEPSPGGLQENSQPWPDC